MSLHGGLDTVAIVSRGVYTKTYGAAAAAMIANLFASRGYLEDAPNIMVKLINIIKHLREQKIM